MIFIQGDGKSSPEIIF